MRVLFLGSGTNWCCSIIAKNILQSFDEKLEVFAAELDSGPTVSQKFIQAMNALGFEITEQEIQSFDTFKDLEIEYLITVSKEARELLKKYPQKYKYKMHMEFTHPYTENQNLDEIIKSLSSYREEMYTELDYFYHYILKEKTAH